MMRRMLRGIVLAAVLATVTVGCSDETQPLQGAPKNVQVLFASSVSLLAVYDVWDAEEITTTTFPDQPDRPPLVQTQDLGLWCAVPESGSEFRSSVTYPYRYRVSIERIRAGSSTPELLSDPSYSSGYSSVTEYDNTPVTPALTHPIDWSTNVSDPATPTITTVVEFRNGRRVSTASREFLVRPKIPANTPASLGSACPYAGYGGLAQNADFFIDPGVAGQHPTFNAELASGDTLVVRAVKDPDPLLLVLYSSNPPSFDGLVFVDGSDVTGTAHGRASSGQGTDEGVAFSFTYR